MKISIVLNRTLNSGQKANVSAIIMGQMGRDIPKVYTNPITDASGTKHAGISINVVILDGGSGQLLSLIESARKSKVICIVFSSTGQMLSNNYAEYQQKIAHLDTESTKIVGVGLCGEDEIIKVLTKKFSLAK